jgi:hypothetical protein
LLWQRQRRSNKAGAARPQQGQALDRQTLARLPPTVAGVSPKGNCAMKDRVLCPCCGYPTLQERGNSDICELCNWEDDGQDDVDADEIRGGPNSDYSLTEARKNFLRYMVMYAPNRDQRITSGDSPLEIETKKALVTLFNKYLTSSDSEKPKLGQEIKRLEAALKQEILRKVREYEKDHAKC